MTNLVITCDRKGDLIRAAVWQGRVLVDLYVGRIAAPDLSGAMVRGKVARTLAGQKTAWVEAGLAEKIFVQSKKPLKTGEVLTLRIQTTMEEGKAWVGEIAENLLDAPETLGLLLPPPLPWQRALMNLKKGERASLLFAAKEDFLQYQKSGAAFSVLYEGKGPVHAQLDEMISGLQLSIVPLSGGASLIIQPTAALVAIDVNGGASSNPTATNLVAVREAARQIRLRNLSGIIVIDCLKMASRADASKVVNAFERVAADDPAGVSCFGLNKLGLLEATRTRYGPPLAFLIGA
ncbi:MAG: ribonuclease E/G [Bdellovibrionales bacterium]|jgi:Ribonuclease G/E